MLEIGLEVFYGNTKAGAITAFVFKTTQLEFKEEYVTIVKENLHIDLNETSIAFCPFLEGKCAKLLKQLAREKGLWFNLK